MFFPCFFFKLIFEGENCLNASYWTQQQTTGIFCHKLTLPNSFVYGPYERLQISFMIDPVSASPTGRNDLHVEIYFVMPGSHFSVKDHRIMTKIGPGYSHKIGLELFQYADNSGTTDCLNEGTRGVLNYNEEYTYPLCIDECVTLKEQMRCGCNSLRYARLDDNVRDCGVFDMVICPFDSGEALGKLLNVGFQFKNPPF